MCVQPEMRHGASTQHWWVRALTPIQRKEDGRVRGASREPCEYMHENVSSPTPCPSSSSSSSFPFFAIDVAIKRENIFGGFGGLTGGGGGGLLTFFLAGSMRDKGLLTFAAILKFLFYRVENGSGRICAAAVFVKKKRCVWEVFVYSCTLVYLDSVDFSKEKLRNELIVNYI